MVRQILAVRLARDITKWQEGVAVGDGGEAVRTDETPLFHSVGGVGGKGQRLGMR